MAALTSDQIAGAVSYYTNQRNVGSALTASITAPRAAPQNVGGIPGMVPASMPGGISSAQSAQDRTGNSTFGTDALNQAIGGLKKSGTPDWLTGYLKAYATPTAGILNEATAPQGPDQAPKNFTQWVMNLLGTGMYASGRFLNEAGHNLSVAQKTGTPSNPIDNIARTVHDNVSPFLAGVRGAAEGLGFRYDNQKPMTPGGDLHDSGISPAIARTITNGNNASNEMVFGADPKLVKQLNNQNPTTNGVTTGVEGTINFGADVLADPLLLVGGAGGDVLKGARAAISAAGDTIRAGGKSADVLIAASKAGLSGSLRSAADRTAVKLSSAERAVLTKTARDQAATRTATDVAQTAAIEGRPVSVAAGEAAVKAETKGATLLPKEAPALLPKEVPALVAKTTANPRAAAVNDLLSTLSTRGRSVDSTKILADARQPIASAKIAPEIANTATSVLHDAKTVPEIQAGLKTLKATREGKTFLATPIKVGDQQATVGAALERGAMARVTGGSDSGDLATQAVMQHLSTLGPAFRTTPASLGTSIEQNVPELGAQGVPLDVPRLMGSLAGKSQADRQKIVANVLNLPSAPFTSFDKAIEGAVHGQVEGSAMRSMLQALGIKTRAVKEDTLRTLLNGRGKMEWEKIQQGIPTAQEVLNKHGITAEVADVAKTVDVAAERAGAATEATQMQSGLDGAALAGYNAGIAAGRADDKLIASPIYVEGYGTRQFNTINQPIIGTISRIANNLKGSDGKALTALERADFMHARVLPAMAAADRAMMAEGRIARLQSGVKQEAFYVPLEQQLRHLDPGTVDAALFNLDFRLTKAGEGYPVIDGVRAQSPKFQQGLTVFPTTIAFGAKAAHDGYSIDGIVGAMSRYGNEFEKSTAGKAVIQQLAREMSTDSFRAEMRAAHLANQTLAVANAQKAATDFVNPIASEIMAGVLSGGDRSAAINAAQDGSKKVADMATEADGSMVQDMAGQRLHNGTVAAFGPEGVAMARLDAKTAPASTKAALKAQKMFNDKVGAVRYDGAQQNAENLASFQRDMDPLLDAGARQMIADGAYPDTAEGIMMSKMELEQSLGKAAFINKIGWNVDGTFGEGGAAFGAAGVRLQVVDGAHRGSTEYIAEIKRWYVGGRKLEDGTKLGPLGRRIADDIGVQKMLKPDEVTNYTRNWFQALQAHVRQSLSEDKVLTYEELLARLQNGLPRGGAVADPAAALSPAQAQMAVELMHHINEVFSPVNGAMARLGATPADVVKELARYGLKNDVEIDPGITLAAQASSWVNWDTTQMAPLDTLMRAHQALSAASIRPSIMASAMNRWGHIAVGKDASEALKEGWKYYDPARNTGLGVYANKKILLPPDIHKQLQFTNARIEEIEKMKPGDLGRYLKWYDRIMNIVKQSMTSYNPSHWVTNFLGDSAFNLSAGVDPRHGFRALRVIHASGLIENDPAPLLDAAHASGYIDAAAASKHQGRFLGNDLHVIVGSDKNGWNAEPLSIEKLKQLGMETGVDVLGHRTNDVMNHLSGGTRGDRYTRFANSKLNPFSYTNKFIDKGSAVRDNIPRYTQFFHELQKQKYPNLDAAISAAAAAVHATHPTGSALSGFERNVMRRTITFYTWQRLALGRIAELALEHPTLVSAPSKFQYEQAKAAGFDPESIGKPFGNDPRIASYTYNGLYGPTYTSGYSPFGGTGDLGGTEPHKWGYQLSIPVMDTMMSAFQGLTLDGDIWKNLDQVINSNVSPVIEAPLQWLSNHNPGGIGKPPQSDPVNFWLGKSGAPGRIAKAAGLLPKTTASGAPANTPAQQAGDNARQAVNYLTGLKFNDFTNDTSKAFAAKERGKQQVAAWTNAGYTPAQVKMLQQAKKP